MKSYGFINISDITSNFNLRNRNAFFASIYRHAWGRWPYIDNVNLPITSQGYSGGELFFYNSGWKYLNETYEVDQYIFNDGLIKKLSNAVVRLIKIRSSLADVNIGKRSLSDTTEHYSGSQDELDTSEIIFRMNKMNNQEMNADERYALAILRPNILTSDIYASTFLEGTSFNFITEEVDKNCVIFESEVDKFVKFYRDQGYLVSIEKGFDKKDHIESVRMVVMNKPIDPSGGKELVCIWLFMKSDYSLHFKEREDIKELLAFMRDKEVKTHKVITRCYSGGGEISTSNVKIDGRFRIHDEFYPSVHEHGGMTSLISRFRKSSSNLLIFAGQWGGGKSALFQAMCYEDSTEENSYYLIDDPNVYSDPNLFSEIINLIDKDNRDGKTSYLFLEEADDFIRDKRENPFLSRLASLSNGAASLKVKIVVATNDTSESSIDPALTRPGRLFSMVKFGLLNPKQSNKARQVVGLDPVEFMEDMSLSEALTETPIFAGLGTTKTKKLNMGFASI